MMGLGKTKDLDEWLMNSGESAETAESKVELQMQFGNRVVLQSKLVQPLKIGGENDVDEPSDVEEDWMF
jgi:hypothetical protein